MSLSANSLFSAIRLSTLHATYLMTPLKFHTKLNTDQKNAFRKKRDIAGKAGC